MSQVERFIVTWIDPDGKGEQTPEVDLKRPAQWKKEFKPGSTKDSYELIERAKKHKALFSGLQVTIMGEGGNQEWIDLSMYEQKQVSPETLEETLVVMRKLQGSGQVQLVVKNLYFELGQDLLDWVEEIKTTLKPGEVKQ
jgi:hypothetical protein